MKDTKQFQVLNEGYGLEITSERDASARAAAGPSEVVPEFVDTVLASYAVVDPEPARLEDGTVDLATGGGAPQDDMARVAGPEATRPEKAKAAAKSAKAKAAAKPGKAKTAAIPEKTKASVMPKKNKANPGKTKVKIVASPGSNKNIHEVLVEGEYPGEGHHRDAGKRHDE